MPSILKTYFKRGLYALLVLFMGNLFLFGNIGEGQSAWAQGNTPTQSTQQRLTEKLTDRTVYAATFNKILYILIRPLLVVAGWAMDNGMIYGEFFGFDSALWTIWNLTKNIANFALGFLFLYVLFKNLFGS
ncbi:hypothetical protein FACS1894176_03760 [Bacteroidia bacterium]|nr:hypothetical protein FACS1894176_03760 [Bacteroidia bacterium]